MARASAALCVISAKLASVATRASSAVASVCAGVVFFDDGVGFGVADGCEIGVETDQRFLGFGDEAGFARDVGFELLDARIEFLGAVGGALGFAIEIVLLDLETRENCGFLGFRCRAAAAGFRQAAFPR